MIRAGIPALLILSGIPRVAAARPELVPLSPGVSIQAQAAAHLGYPAVNVDGSRIAYVHGFDPLG